MLATKLYTKEYDVDARLASFGITRAELVDVLKLILSARSDAIHVDPLSAPGQFSFIYGTRHIRLLLCPKGWVIDRKENIESVRNDKLKISIVFQNVDQACDPMHSPKALHSKGSASTRLVDQGQGSLFPDDCGLVLLRVLPRRVRPGRIVTSRDTQGGKLRSFSGADFHHAQR
jgi:hypothetical protein